MAMEALMTTLVKKTGLGDFEVNEDPNGPKVVRMRILYYYIIYKMGICQLE